MATRFSPVDLVQLQSHEKPVVAVFGHSFVRRLWDHLVPLNQIDMNLSDISLIFHGVGGLTLQGSVYEESQVAVHVCPTALVVDLGANDLDSLHYPDPHELASAMFVFLTVLRSRAHCRSVVVVQAFHRTSPRRHDFNDVLPEYNHHLKSLCNKHPSNGVHFFPLRNIIHNWESFLLPDGVHFNSTGIQRYMRNIRGAVLLSLK